MAIQQSIIKHIDGGIFGIAGYYTPNDSKQHVIVAVHDGTIYEIHWSAKKPPTDPQRLAHFNGLACLSGFFSQDDVRQHVVVATNDLNMHEIYFTEEESPALRSPLTHVNDLNAYNGMAGFYSAGDDFRHAVIVGQTGTLYDVTFNSQQLPTTTTIATPFHTGGVASISGFFASNNASRHIVIALKNGHVYDHSYPDEAHTASVTQQDVVAQSAEPLVNVTSFFAPDTNFYHYVVLTTNGNLYDHARDLQGGIRMTTLPSFKNVVDIASYYSIYDSIRHVIVATSDGNLHEVTYTSQG